MSYIHFLRNVTYSQVIKLILTCGCGAIKSKNKHRNQTPLSKQPSENIETAYLLHSSYFKT